MLTACGCIVLSALDSLYNSRQQRVGLKAERCENDQTGVLSAADLWWQQSGKARAWLSQAGSLWVPPTLWPQVLHYTLHKMPALQVPVHIEQPLRVGLGYMAVVCRMSPVLPLTTM